MTCAKKIVKAVLLLRDGSIFYGTNDCRKPQQTCPRKPGDDYTLCGTVCQQPFHAEIHALTQAIIAGKDVDGAHMKVHNRRICPDCAVTLAHFKVTAEVKP